MESYRNSFLKLRLFRRTGQVLVRQQVCDIVFRVLLEQGFLLGVVDEFTQVQIQLARAEINIFVLEAAVHHHALEAPS